jgi:hypothetical protein
MEERLEKGAPVLAEIAPGELHLGDRFTDDIGEWEAIRRPFVTAAGKNAHVTVRMVDRPEFTDLRTWGAHERIRVKRASPL